MIALLGKTWAEVTDDDYRTLLARLDLKPRVIEFPMDGGPQRSEDREGFAARESTR
jgi:hypothetical protein